MSSPCHGELSASASSVGAAWALALLAAVAACGGAEHISQQGQPASLDPQNPGGVGGSSGSSGGGGAASKGPGGETNEPGGFAGGIAGLGGTAEPGEPPDFATLREAAAAAGKRIGVAVDAIALRSDPTYAEVLAREFDYVTPEDAGKWGPLAPSPTTNAFEDLDAIVGFAEASAQAVKGHTFVWHQQTPTWLSEDMSAEQVSSALRTHIEATLARYRGRMRAWDVVNEAVDVATESGYTDSIFYRKLGPQYIEDAFRWARAADPDVLLFYNEIGIERMGAKSDFTYAMLRDLLARGVPIDGIGLQSHVSIHRYPAENDLRANIRRFAELGLTVNVSEADVRVLLMPGDQAARWQAQRIAFQQIVGACAVEPGCEAVTLWGFTDRYSWINDDGGADEPLIFDRDYVAKPGYDGVIAGFSGQLPVPGENLVTEGDFAANGSGWSALGGELSVAAAADRTGNAACITNRADENAGLRQASLQERLSAGGPLVISAWVRLQGAATGTAQATLRVQEQGLAARDLSLAVTVANEGGWVELTGYFGLGFEAAPLAIELDIHGPPAGVDLCVADVRIQPLSAQP